MSNPNLITQKELAKHLGVSPQRISTLKRQGRLVLNGRKVDLEATLAKLKTTTDPSQHNSIGGKEREDEEQMEFDYNLERARREYFMAALAELEFREKASKLVPMDEVLDDAATVSIAVREGMTAIPPRVAPTLATMDDVDAIEEFLMDEIEKALRTTSKYLKDMDDNDE